MHESEKWKWSPSVESDPQRPHGLQPTRLLRPRDFPGQEYWSGCHCLLRILPCGCVKKPSVKNSPIWLKGWRVYVRVKVLVAQLCLTLFDPMDCSLPGSSIHGILQGRILEWVAIPSSRGSSPPRDWIPVSCIGRWILYHLSHWEVQYTGLQLLSKNSHLPLKLCCFRSLCAFRWRRQWHPTPVLLPGKSHGQRSLVGCSPWGR